jgi:hypothetical protein
MARNPFRSESEAFRFVLLLVGYFAAIVVAKALFGTWAALGVFVVLTLVGVVLLFGGRKEPPQQTTPVHRGGPDERRILVVANETVGGEALRDVIREKSEGFREQVLVVCPALNSPLRHWASDEDPARREAQARLARSLDQLAEVGVSAAGEVGDSEPLQAIEDALRTFGADEVIISTHPEGRSHWLEKGVVSGARQRFAVPITHVVVDLEAEREEVT